MFREEEASAGVPEGLGVALREVLRSNLLCLKKEVIIVRLGKGRLNGVELIRIP